MLDAAKAVVLGLTMATVALGLQSCSAEPPDLVQTLEALPRPPGVSAASPIELPDSVLAEYVMPEVLSSEAVLDFYTAELVDSGWDQEDVVIYLDPALFACSSSNPFSSCLSFRKDGVRVTVQVASASISDMIRGIELNEETGQMERSPDVTPEAPEPDSFLVHVEQR